jgi:hypothetical protein
MLKMNTIKKLGGIVWMIAGPVLIFLLIKTGLAEIAKNPVMDTRIQWGVFIIIFIPIAIGFSLFGWFALKGEYDHLPESSDEI